MNSGNLQNGQSRTKMSMQTSAQRQKKYRDKRVAELRKELFEHFEKKCACCGETEPLFLSVDHINNDGYKERERSSKGNILLGVIGRLQLIKAQRFPKDKYQILCMNCNTGKHRNNGICPHKA